MAFFVGSVTPVYGLIVIHFDLVCVRCVLLRWILARSSPPALVIALLLERDDSASSDSVSPAMALRERVRVAQSAFDALRAELLADPIHSDIMERLQQHLH